MRLKPTKSTIIVLCTALAVVILASGGLFWVQRGWLVETTEQLRAKELELQDGQRIARRRDDARAALDADKSLIANLEPGVSNAAYVPTLLKQLEQLAGSTKNKVNGVRPQVVQQAPTKIQQRRDPDAQGKEVTDDKKEKVVEEPYTRLEIEVNLEGKFESTQRFVEQLMRFPKIVAVEQLTLRPKQTGQEGATGILEVQLKLTAFIMKGDVPLNVPAAKEVASADLGGIN